MVKPDISHDPKYYNFQKIQIKHFCFHLYIIVRWYGLLIWHVFTLCCKSIRSSVFLWCKMLMFRRAGMREGGKPPSNEQIVWIPRRAEENLRGGWVVEFRLVGVNYGLIWFFCRFSKLFNDQPFLFMCLFTNFWEFGVHYILSN